MSKVYCENCKYYELFGFWHPECWRFCICYSRGGKIYQDFVGRLEKDIEQNKKNKCPYYQRKWYKFWLKD